MDKIYFLFLLVLSVGLTFLFMFFFMPKKQSVNISVIPAPRKQTASVAQSLPKISLLLYPAKFKGNSKSFKNLSPLLNSKLDKAITSSSMFEAKSIETQLLINQVENFLKYGTEEREVNTIAKGDGVSRRDALENAFLNAVEQVCGVFISSQQSTHKEYVNNNGKSEFYVSFQDRTNKTITARIIKYSIVSEKQFEGGQYEVNINVRVVSTRQEKVDVDSRYILIPVVERMAKTQTNVPFSNKRKDGIEVDIDLNLIDLYTMTVIPLKDVSTSVYYLSNKYSWPNDMNAFYTHLITKASSMVVQSLKQVVNHLIWSSNLIYKNGEFFINRGAMDGVKVGMKMRIMRKLYPILDPKTQKVINYRMEGCSKAIVKEIYENYAVLSVYKKIVDPTNCVVELDE